MMRILSWLCCKFGRHDMYPVERRFALNGGEYRKRKCLSCNKVSYQIRLSRWAENPWTEYWPRGAVPFVFQSPARCHTGEHLKSECPGDHGK